MPAVRHQVRRIARFPNKSLFAGLAAVAMVLTYAACSSAAPAAELPPSPAGSSFIHVDWQDPSSLPPRFRDHCGFNPYRGRYCANHCGLGYEFYFCSRLSFGCCHAGYGYCDWKGRLRCAP
jgi:hypothetical protein